MAWSLPGVIPEIPNGVQPTDYPRAVLSRVIPVAPSFFESEVRLEWMNRAD